MSQHSFQSLTEIRAALTDLAQADAGALTRAQNRNMQLTKPPGALGRLEDLAIWYGSWRGTDRPSMEAPQVVVFAGNHGVAARGVSAFPPEVTVQMVANFEAGGAAVNQLAKCFGASFSVHALDLDRPTADFTAEAAMSEAEICAAFTTGWQSVDAEADLLITGEMGIGNTTSAAAIACALFGGAPGDWTGRGTGVDNDGLDLKTKVVAEGLALHAAALEDPLEVLRCLGGRELAAMAGAILRARTLSIPVILDGFICCAAAAVLYRMNPTALEHCVGGHQSAENAHRKMLATMGKPALLELDMRLGEASGATLAIGVLKGAIACHSGMATFAEAGVAGG